MDYSYRIYSPSGNDTALVLAWEKDRRQRQRIAKQILARHPQVEQVGFLHKSRYQLQMAGGEFCGNALRAAGSYYLGDSSGEIKVQSSGAEHVLRVGRQDTGEVYAQMLGAHSIHELVQVVEQGFLVKLPGIVQVVIPLTGKQVQELFLSNVKKQTREILTRQGLMAEPAAGVIFTWQQQGKWHIFPCVRVAAVDTMICERACGSGTMAVGLVHSLLTGKDVDMPFIQPSKQIIRAQVWRAGNRVQEGRISGQVSKDGRKYTLHTGKG